MRENKFDELKNQKKKKKKFLNRYEAMPGRFPVTWADLA